MDHYRKSNVKKNISAVFATMLLLSMFFWGGSVFAQTRGELTVIKDPRIDSLIAYRLLAAKAPSNHTILSSGRGYRVQFFISSNRDEVYAKQAEFNQMYPDLRTYIIYQEPNYKIKAGDFRTRLEAQKLVHDIRPMFSTLFIISEKINPQRPDSNDDQN